MNPELLEKLIRYVDDMAGCGFEDAEKLMYELWDEYEIELDETDGALERLIKKVKENAK